MTITFHDNGLVNITSILGSIESTNILLHHIAKVLWEQPGNIYYSDTRTADSRVLVFSTAAEREIKECQDAAQ